MSNDRVTTIVDELADSQVYVESGLLPAEHVESLTEMVADSPIPIYVVYASLDFDDEFNGREGQMLALVQDEFEADGVYVSTGESGLLTVREHGVPSQHDALWVAEEEGDAPGETLERFVELVSTGTAEEAYEVLQETLETSETDGSSSGSSSSSGDSTDTVAMLTVIGLLVALVLALIYTYRARTRRHHRQVAKAFSVPSHVLEAVRGARSDAVAEQARVKTLALGESLDRTDVPAGGSALTEYQAALDAYDAAGRTLDRGGELADLVGALVLAETGDAHLQRAHGRDAVRRRELPRPCYFNPLHGAAAHTVRLPGGARSDTVRVCDTCAGQVNDGVEPDTLHVTVDDRDVPYFESGLEPWASTGYGALRSNLVERVLTGT